MSQKIHQTALDIKNHLDQQLKFLERSTEAFDSGLEDEAVRIAVVIRILLHDTDRSKSLLGQLNRLDINFLDTSWENKEGNGCSYGGLVGTVLGPGSCYTALLDSAGTQRWIPFKEWWDATVFSDIQGRTITRKHLILTAANQDGGAHVDPNLDAKYAALSRENSYGWMVEDNGSIKHFAGADRVAIRQIAHEVLRTLIPTYRKAPKPRENSVVIGGIYITSEATASTSRPSAVRRKMKTGRNDTCPCGSGLKYKRCHGQS